MSASKQSAHPKGPKVWLTAFTAHMVEVLDHVVVRLDRPILFGVLVAAVAALALALLGAATPFTTEGFSPEQISYLSMPDTRVQRSFYVYLSAMVFSGALAVGLLRPLAGQAKLLQNGTFFAALSFQGVIAISVCVLYLFLLEPKVDDLVLAVLTWLVFVRMIDGRISTGSTIVALAIASALFFGTPLLIGSPVMEGQLWPMDIHWSAILGHGIAAERVSDLGLAAFSGYGILFNGLILGARELFGLSTLAEVQTLLGLGNLVFCLLVLAIIQQRSTTPHTAAVALLLLVLFSAIVTGLTANLIYPNQLPIRFLLFPVTLLLSYWLAGRAWPRSSAIFGAAAALMLFYNFETGLLCVVGLGFAMFLQTAKRGVMTLAAAIVIFAATAAATSFSLIALLFEDPIIQVGHALFEAAQAKLSSGSSGYGSLKVHLYPPFIIIMAHVIMLFARYLVDIRGQKPLDALAFQSATTVGLIIAIGPYVMNRFDVLNMWTPALLYALLVVPDLLSGGAHTRRIKSFILIVVILPFIYENPVRRSFSYDRVAAFDSTLAPCIDGLTTATETCVYSAAKSQALVELFQTHVGLGWMSGLALTMSQATGLAPTLTEKSPFFFGHNEANRTELIRQVHEAEATTFAIDRVIEGNPAGIPVAVEQFQRNLLEDAGYMTLSVGTYWTIMTRDAR